MTPRPLTPEERQEIEARLADQAAIDWNVDGSVIWTVETTQYAVPECCGRLSPSGDCCNNPVARAEYTQEQAQIGGGPAEVLEFADHARTDIPRLLAAEQYQRERAERLAGALRFILAFYEPGQRYLDTEAWKVAEANARAALAEEPSA